MEGDAGVSATSTPSVDTTPVASAPAVDTSTQSAAIVPPVVPSTGSDQAASSSGFSWTLVLGFIVLALALVIGAYYLV